MTKILFLNVIVFMSCSVAPASADKPPQDDLAVKCRDLIVALSSDESAIRDRAHNEFIALGKKALPYLQGATTHDDAEVRSQVAVIIRTIISTYTLGGHLGEASFLRSPGSIVSICANKSNWVSLDSEGTVTWWDCKSGERLKTLSLSQYVSINQSRGEHFVSLHRGADEERLVIVTSFQVLVLTKISTQIESRVITVVSEHFRESISAAHVSISGNRCALWLKTSQRVEVFDLIENKRIESMAIAKGEASGFGGASTNEFAYVTPQGEYRQIDLEKGSLSPGVQLKDWSNHSGPIAIGGDYIVNVSQKNGKIWKGSSGEAERTSLELRGKQVTFINGYQAAVILPDSQVAIVDLAKGSTSFTTRTSLWSTVAWDSDRHLLLTGAIDGGVFAWDVGTGKSTLGPRAPKHRISSVTLDSSGRTVYTGCIDGTVQAWDVPNRTVSWEKELEHPTRVKTLALSDLDQRLCIAQNAFFEMPSRSGTPSYATEPCVAELRDEQAQARSSRWHSPTRSKLYVTAQKVFRTVQDPAAQTFEISTSQIPHIVEFSDARFLLSGKASFLVGRDAERKNVGYIVSFNGSFQPLFLNVIGFSGFDSDASRLLLHQGNKILVLELSEDPSGLRAIQGMTEAALMEANIVTAALLPGTDFCFVSLENGSVVLFDTKAKKTVRSVKTKLQKVDSILVSADGNALLLLGNTSREIEVWYRP